MRRISPIKKDTVIKKKVIKSNWMLNPASRPPRKSMKTSINEFIVLSFLLPNFIFFLTRYVFSITSQTMPPKIIEKREKINEETLKNSKNKAFITIKAKYPTKR